MRRIILGGVRFFQQTVAFVALSATYFTLTNAALGVSDGNVITNPGTQQENAGGVTLEIPDMECCDTTALQTKIELIKERIEVIERLIERILNKPNTSGFVGGTRGNISTTSLIEKIERLESITIAIQQSEQNFDSMLQKMQKRIDALSQGQNVLNEKLERLLCQHHGESEKTAAIMGQLALISNKLGLGNPEISTSLDSDGVVRIVVREGSHCESQDEDSSDDKSYDLPSRICGRAAK